MTIAVLTNYHKDATAVAASHTTLPGSCLMRRTKNHART